MREFRDFLLSTIDRLDRRYDAAPPEAVLEAGRDYAVAAERAGNLAAKLGLADLYRRSLDFGEFAEWPHVKAYLAECLAAVPAPPEPVPIGETIGVEELAATLGVNVRTIYRRRNDGTLPAPIQVGRLVRWRRADVEAFMAGK
jgi:excisionase family DNA binding protein